MTQFDTVAFDTYNHTYAPSSVSPLDELGDLRRVLRVLLMVGDARSKTSSSSSETDVFFALKLHAHLSTLHDILLGRKLEETLVLDLFSAHVVLRAAIECFLTYEYLHMLPDTSSKIEMRTLLWKYSAYFQWKDFDDSDGEFSSEKAEVVVQFDAIKQSIINHQGFSSLSASTQARIQQAKSVPARDCGWLKLMEQSGIAKTIQQYWQQASSHAHSEGMSMAQFEYSYSKYDESKTAMFSYTSLCLAAQMIDHLVQRYEACKLAFESMNSQEKWFSLLWARVYQKMSSSNHTS